MNPLDAKEIVATLGTLGVLATLFIETGLLVGLLLPGDSLLFVAGIAASGTAREIFGNQLSYVQLLIWAPIAATVGSQCGHWLGAKYGRPFFDRPNSRFFNQERVAQTERWNPPDPRGLDRAAPGSSKTLLRCRCCRRAGSNRPREWRLGGRRCGQIPRSERPSGERRDGSPCGCGRCSPRSWVSRSAVAAAEAGGGTADGRSEGEQADKLRIGEGRCPSEMAGPTPQ